MVIVFNHIPAILLEIKRKLLVLIVWINTGDGFHGFGIKEFDVSREIARSDTVTIEFTADVAGEFPILCTEYCGDGHEEMKGQLVVKAHGAEQP